MLATDKHVELLVDSRCADVRMGILGMTFTLFSYGWWSWRHGWGGGRAKNSVSEAAADDNTSNPLLVCSTVHDE